MLPGIPPILVKLGAVAALVAAAGVFGYTRGKSDCEAAHNAELLKQIEEAEKLDEQRRQVQQERDELARRLEEEGNAEPVTVYKCLSPSRVRRLQKLR